MGILIVSHTSALRIWRDQRCSQQMLAPMRIEPTQTCATGLHAARELLCGQYPGFAQSPTMHLLVFGSAKRHRLANAIVHATGMGYEDYAAGDADPFFRLSVGIAISGPELLFVQMGSILGYEQLFLLGLELCGTYSINARDPKGFTDGLPPLTTPQRLASYVSAASGLKGLGLAKQVVGRLECNSASPQESRVFVKLAAPHCKGGYDVKGLELNREIALSPDAAKIAGQRICRADIVHAPSKLAIEYDSALMHENVAQGQKDKRRRDALEHDGWTAKSLVPATANQPDAFGIFARDALRATGRHGRIRAKDFERKRAELFRSLSVPD